MLAINTAPWIPVEDWRAFWHSKGAGDVFWANDVDQEMLKSFNVTRVGTTIIIDRQGQVSYRDAGATPYDVLRTEIEKTL